MTTPPVWGTSWPGQPNTPIAGWPMASPGAPIPGQALPYNYYTQPNAAAAYYHQQQQQQAAYSAAYAASMATGTQAYPQTQPPLIQGYGNYYMQPTTTPLTTTTTPLATTAASSTTPGTTTGTTTLYTMEQATYYWKCLDYYGQPPANWPPPPFPRPSTSANNQSVAAQTTAATLGTQPAASTLTQSQVAGAPPAAVNCYQQNANAALALQKQQQGNTCPSTTTPSGHPSNNTATNHITPQKRKSSTTHTEPLTAATKSSLVKPDYIAVGKKKHDTAAWRAKRTKSQQGDERKGEDRDEDEPREAKDGIPDSFKRYIGRLYANVPSDCHKHIDNYVKSIFSKHTLAGTLVSHDWEKEHIPTVVQLQGTEKKGKKKRRSNGGTKDPAGLLSPTQDDAFKGPLAGRLTKQKKKQRHIGMMLVDDGEEMTRRADRAKRFETMRPKSNASSIVWSEDDDNIDWDQEHIVGTCQDLEKPYLRLTSRPEAHTVRPLTVLKKALEHVKFQMAQGRDYTYCCEQFKSIRQDLTVQSLTNGLAVEAYETHARVALRNNDLSEFNQCQTQLISLYEKGLPGAVAEFAAYRILYQLYTRSDHDLLKAMSNIALNIKRDTAILHAMEVVSAVNLGNYKRFFSLYKVAPNLGQTILKQLLPRQRAFAVRVISKVYQPTYAISDLVDALMFDNTDECVRFLLVEMKVKLNDDFTQLLTRDVVKR